MGYLFAREALVKTLFWSSLGAGLVCNPNLHDEICDATAEYPVF
jgi:hypothetical protein